VLLVEELVAMLLQNARDLAAAHGETKVKDCVITVPSFFTQAEREALLDAAAIAEVNVLALIDENTAAALQFAIDNVYPDKPHRMVMYNMGAKAAQVSVFEFSGKHVKRGASNITQGMLL
jgi:hypoxia up-regulated 1